MTNVLVGRRPDSPRGPSKRGRNIGVAYQGVKEWGVRQNTHGRPPKTTNYSDVRQSGYGVAANRKSPCALRQFLGDLTYVPRGSILDGNQGRPTGTWDTAAEAPA